MLADILRESAARLASRYLTILFALDEWIPFLVIRRAIVVAKLPRGCISDCSMIHLCGNVSAISAPYCRDPIGSRRGTDKRDYLATRITRLNLVVRIAQQFFGQLLLEVTPACQEKVWPRRAQPAKRGDDFPTRA